MPPAHPLHLAVLAFPRLQYYGAGCAAEPANAPTSRELWVAGAEGFRRWGGEQELWIEQAIGKEGLARADREKKCITKIYTNYRNIIKETMEIYNLGSNRFRIKK